MKNLKQFFVAIMIVVAMFFQNKAISQPSEKTWFPTPDPDGYYRFSTLESYVSLWDFTNSSCTTKTTKITDLFSMGGFYTSSGQSFIIFSYISLRAPAATINALGVSINYGSLSGGGNYAFSSNATGTPVFSQKSYRNIANDMSTYVINTNDGTWYPSIGRNGDTTLIKLFKVTLDSIPAAMLTANGTFYIKELMNISVANPPAGYSYPNTYALTPAISEGPFKMDMPNREVKAPKKVDAQIATNGIATDGSVVSAFSTGSTESSVSTAVSYFPTNYYDSNNSKKIIVELRKKDGNMLIARKVQPTYWDIVDEVNTGIQAYIPNYALTPRPVNGRTDVLSLYQTWENLPDSTAYIVNLYDSIPGSPKVLRGSQEIITKLKRQAPQTNELVISNITHNSATVTFKYTRGNANATPYEVSVYSPDGVINTKSFSTYGTIGELVTESWNVTGCKPSTLHAVHIKKDGTVVKPQVTFTTTAEPIVVTNIDPISWTSDAVISATDGKSAVYTIKCTPGNDAPPQVIVTVIAPGGRPIYVNNSNTISLTSASIPLTIEGTEPGAEHRVEVTIQRTGQANEVKTFTFKSASSGGGTVGIISATSTDIYIYPNPTSDYISIQSAKKLPVSLYDLSGKLVIESTTAQTLSVSHLPRGNYILSVDGQTHRVSLQ